MKKTKISEFLKNDYRRYWKHENQNKNAFDPREGLKVVERKILFAARNLNLQLYGPVLTRKLAGDTGEFHISGEASVQDTIKGMASTYKRQPETCLLKGIGAFPTSPSNTGAAARYTSVVATPLSRKIFEDIDFCPWVVDDSGVKQVEFVSPAIPIVLVRGTKGIGVGKGCYVTERKHDEIYDWSRQIIDLAFPDKGGSGWTKRFIKEATAAGISTTEEIREFISDKVFHDKMNSEDEIKGIKVPGPYNHMGALVEYNEEKHSIMFRPRIEKETKDRKTRYFITALPIETSDRIVVANIRKKFGDKIADQCVDHSGDENPIKLEIPKKIAEDESLWFGLRMKRGYTEAYCIWDNELDTTRIIAHLYPILIEWYKTREEIVSRRLFKSIASLLKKIEDNNLIKKYYDLREESKIKTEKDASKFFNEDEVRYLINLPEKTYLKENVDRLQESNKKLEDSIKETKKNLENIKDFIFAEWKEVAEANKKFIES